MSNKNKAEQQSGSLLRTPKAKHKLGLKVPTIAMPHEDLIQPERLPEEVSNKLHLEIVPTPVTQPSQSTPTSPSTLTTQTRTGTPTSQTIQTKNPVFDSRIAPSKNFQKVPNSITKLAIPEGVFVGKSKQLYDVLYGLTRGAINPVRKIRISKTKLMKQSGIGARITFDSSISRLQSAGLLKTIVLPGEHEGNEYEIFLPEESITLTSQSTPSRLTSQSTLTDSAQNLDGLVSLETSQSRQSLNSAGSDLYENSKTSLKTFKTDDDDSVSAFVDFIGEFSRVSEKLTGKKLSGNDAKKWKTLADLLILELEIAASRAGTVSNIPAFLTEVLRRKLMNKPSQLPKPTDRKIDVVGKDTSAEFEIKMLDEQGRESALAELQEFADDDFLADFRKWYTPEDWEWLIERLNQIKK